MNHSEAAYLDREERESEMEFAKEAAFKDARTQLLADIKAGRLEPALDVCEEWAAEVGDYRALFVALIDQVRSDMHAGRTGYADSMIERIACWAGDKAAENVREAA